MTRSLFCLGVIFLIGACQSNDVAPKKKSADPSVARSKSSGKTDADRRARFDTRSAAEAPKSLPAPWKRLLKALEHKLVTARIERTSHQTDWRGGIRIELNFRLFGRDADVDARLAAALAKLKLSGVRLPLGSQTHDGGLKGWALELDRAVAPQGSARQTDVTLTWYRRPKPPKKRGRCHKPHGVPMDELLPGWLGQTTSKRSTRRRILAAVKTSTSGTKGRIQMLYHNGFAHDENVGQLAAKALRAGLKKREGEGPNQRFASGRGQRLILSTVRRPHDMGCEPKGPILELEWARSAKE